MIWRADTTRATRYEMSKTALSSSLLIALAGSLSLVNIGCEEGPAGPEGLAGADGGDGAACWDLNGNGEQDLASEDVNGDGVADVIDCQGPAGNHGDDGEDGLDALPLAYVGAATCAVCHEELFETYSRSGHANALVWTDEEDLAVPWADLGDFGEPPSDPPTDHSWGDIAYMLGGWAWKAVFVDDEGWVVTGPEHRFNLATQSWAPAFPDADPQTMSATICMTCHTTGLMPAQEHEDYAAIAATWDFDGVQCEACHGPGSAHAADPYHAPLASERDAEVCGSCHSRGSTSQIPVANGLLHSRSEWNQMFQSTKHSMDCVDCHDPHQSAYYAHAEYNPNKSIRVDCEDCHFQEAAWQSTHIPLDCVDCHMPYVQLTAVVDASTGRGDTRAHLFAINPIPEAPFLTDDGTAYPYLTLDQSCRGCHSAAGIAEEKTDEELASMALGYHAPN